VLKKTKHIAHMCGGVKTLKHMILALPRLWRSPTHKQNTSSKTHPNGCNF